MTMTWFGDLTFPGSAELAMRPYILGLLRASGAGERFRMQKFCLCIGCICDVVAPRALTCKLSVLASSPAPQLHTQHVRAVVRVCEPPPPKC